MTITMNNARTIDVHAHIVLAESMHQAGRFGPEIGYDKNNKPWFRVGEYVLEGVKYENSAFMDMEIRLKAMDEAGIDCQILSPNPLNFFHFVDAKDAINFCQQHNNALKSRIDAYPNRFRGMAALPMQDIAAACDELERAVTELGLVGGYIGTDIGRHLDSHQLDPFYEKLVALDAPLFIHPAPAGIDGPKGDSNLTQYDLDILTGFAAQETLAIATLVYGGVLERHPDLDVCFSHAGGAIPMLMGRLNEAGIRRPWASEALRKDGAFETYVSRLWFDNHVHDPRVLDFVIKMLGTDRLVLGTNFAGWDQHIVEGSNDWNLLLADNARRLLRVK